MVKIGLSDNLEQNMMLIGFLSENNYVQDKISRDPQTGTTGIPNIVYDQFKEQANNEYINKAWLNVDGDYSIFINMPIIYIMHDILHSARQYKKEGNLRIMDVIKQAWRDYDFFLSYQDEEERDKWKSFDILVKTKDKVEKSHVSPISYDIFDNAFIFSILDKLNDIYYIEEICSISALDDIPVVISTIKKEKKGDVVSKLVGSLHLFYENLVVKSIQNSSSSI